MGIFFAVVIAISVLAIVGIRASRRGRELREKVKSDLADPQSATTIDLSAPRRPGVARFAIEGSTAVVVFDVPLADGPIDEVLADLLVAEAVEVLRDEAPGRSITEVVEVVAHAGRGETREVGRRSLELPGALPPAMGFGHLLQFSKFGLDPIAGQFEGEATTGGSAPAGSDDLGPIGDHLVLPKAVDVGLRSRGIDPATMKAGEFVLGLLELFEYDVTSGQISGTYFASKAGQRTFIRDEPHAEGGHPELDADVINQFMFDFSSSGADRGLLVTEKWGPYEIYEREKRQVRVRFITRERLQGFVDALSLG